MKFQLLTKINNQLLSYAFSGIQYFVYFNYYNDFQICCLGAIQIIRDTFLALFWHFSGPPPPYETFKFRK